MELGSMAEFGAMMSQRKEMMHDSTNLAISETRGERGRAARHDAGLARPKQ